MAANEGPKDPLLFYQYENCSKGLFWFLDSMERSQSDVDFSADTHLSSGFGRRRQCMTSWSDTLAWGRGGACDPLHARVECEVGRWRHGGDGARRRGGGPGRGGGRASALIGLHGGGGRGRALVLEQRAQLLVQGLDGVPAHRLGRRL